MRQRASDETWHGDDRSGIRRARIGAKTRAYRAVVEDRSKPCAISGLKDVVADRVANEIAHRPEPQLAHQVGAMRLDRLDADPQRRGRRFVRLAFREQLKYLALAR